MTAKTHVSKRTAPSKTVSIRGAQASRAAMPLGNAERTTILKQAAGVSVAAAASARSSSEEKGQSPFLVLYAFDWASLLKRPLWQKEADTAGGQLSKEKTIRSASPSGVATDFRSRR